MNTYTPPASSVIHDVRVDFSGKRIIYDAVHVVQYDRSLPILAVKMYRNGQAYQVPSSFVAYIRWGKPDGNIVYKPALGCNSTRDTVYFDVTYQMTYFYGIYHPVIQLINGSIAGASSTIEIFVDKNPVPESQIASSSEVVLADVAYTGSYDDLLDKPTIPAYLNQLTEDANHRTVTDSEKSSWNGKSTVSGTSDTNYWLTLTINGVTKSFAAAQGLAIHDVEALPTENINNNVIYRLHQNNAYKYHIHQVNAWIELTTADQLQAAITTLSLVYEPKDATILKKANVVNDVTHTDEDLPLSAKMGRELQQQINNLKALGGRFLEVWDASTGTPAHEPPVSPYQFERGDWYKVGVAGTKNPKASDTYVIGEVNYVEGNELHVGDIIYIGTVNKTAHTCTWSVIANPVVGQIIGAKPKDSSQTPFTVTDGYIIIPEAGTTFGLVKVSSGYGIGITSTGVLQTISASEAAISQKADGNYVITPSNLNFAIKYGLGEYNGTAFDDTQKQTARNTIGASAVSGTYSGTDWQTLTIDGVTKNLPSGGGGGTITDVQVNETSVVVGGVANVPIAGNGVLGVVKISTDYGVGIMPTGSLYADVANDNEIAAKNKEYKPITPTHLDKAVMEGLGNNSLTWTDQYKTNARNTIGASRKIMVTIYEEGD